MQTVYCSVCQQFQNNPCKTNTPVQLHRKPHSWKAAFPNIPPPPPAILGSTPCPLPPGKPFSPGNHFSGELRGDLPCSWPAGDEGQAGTGLQHGQGLLCLGSNATTYGTPQRMGSLKYPSSSSVFGSRAVPGLLGHCCCLLQTSLPGPSGQTGLFFYYTRSLF